MVVFIIERGKKLQNNINLLVINQLSDIFAGPTIDPHMFIEIKMENRTGHGRSWAQKWVDNVLQGT